MKCRILSFAPRLVATKKENVVLLRLLGKDAGILKELSLFTSSSSQALLTQFPRSTCFPSEAENLSRLDKAPRLSISIVIWILSSDTICQLNQFNTNSEAAMLSRSVFLN